MSVPAGGQAPQPNTPPPAPAPAPTPDPASGAPPGNTLPPAAPDPAASQALGGGQALLGPDGKPWDMDRALQTIRNLQAIEKQSKAQAKELEAAQQRLKAIEDKDKSDAEKLASRVAELEAQQTTWQTERQELIVNGAIARLAGQLNLVDAEAASKLLDWSQIEYAEDGQPTNLEAALKALITAKPWLVAANGTPGQAPGATVPATPKGAAGDRTLSPEAAEAARKAAESYTRSVF